MRSANALAGAQGKFAVFIASLFQRTGVATMQELAEPLALFASTLADTDPEEAAILDKWAALVQRGQVS